MSLIGLCRLQQQPAQQWAALLTEGAWRWRPAQGRPARGLYRQSFPKEPARRSPAIFTSVDSKGVLGFDSKKIRGKTVVL